MWGNNGFSATGVDMYGDTTYYGVTSSGGYSDSYYIDMLKKNDERFKYLINKANNANLGSYEPSYEPSYYSSNSNSYTPDFSDSYQSYESPKIKFEEEFDIKCNPKLLSIDEIVAETLDAKFSIISTVYDFGKYVPGQEYNCIVGIRTLDAQNVIGYGEIKFNSADDAKKAFQQFNTELSKDKDIDITQHSVSLRDNYSDGTRQETKFILKDEYWILTYKKNDSHFYEYFDCPGCLEDRALSRINPQYLNILDLDEGYTRLSKCNNPIVKATDINFPPEVFQFREGQYTEKLVLRDSEKVVGIKSVCQIEIAFPDFIYPIQVFTIMDMSFDNESSAHDFYVNMKQFYTDSLKNSENQVTIFDQFINKNSFAGESKFGSGGIVQEKNSLVAFNTIMPKEFVYKFEDYKPLIQKSIERINPQIKSVSAQPAQDNSDLQKSGGGCLIATATYGTELAPQVQMLREIRDNKVMQTESGSSFMKTFNDFYYSFSPVVADLERENPMFKETVKIAITPMVSSLSILNYVDVNSEQEMLGYGISLILLNLGMYVGVPLGLFVTLKNKKW
jgi:hypothetical protein